MLTPEEIQAREFAAARRGYDPADVRNFLARVSGEMERLTQRVRQLEGNLAAEREARAQQPQPPAPEPQPDPSVEQVAKASALFAEISQETQRILEAAQEAGSQIVRKAKHEADREMHGARMQAAKLIAEGERRREAIERALEGMDSARAGLADQLRGVSGTIERLLRELDPEPESSATMRDALAEQAREASGAERLASSEARTVEPGADAEESAHAWGGRAEPVRGAASDPEADQGELAEPGVLSGDAGEVGESEVAGGEAARVGEADGIQSTAEAEVAAPDLFEHADEQAAEADTATAPASETLDDDQPLTVDLDAAAALTGHDAPAALRDRPEPGQVDEPAGERRQAASDTEREQPADEGDLVSASAQRSADSGDDSGEDNHADVIPIKPPRGGMIIDGDQLAPQALRAAALNHLQPKLVRSIKRGMHELHNVVLDRMRRSAGERDPSAFLPTQPELRALAGLVDDLLAEGYDSGSTAASRLVDRRLPHPSVGRGLGEDFADDASGRVLRSLLATLRMGLSSGEDLEPLTNRVRSTFGELKSATAEQLAATHLIHAYELGMLDTWAAGGITHRRWVLGKEPRCPEGRCRHNDQTGALALGEPFPSGHDAPPVHVGCTCTTVPIAEPA